MKFTIYIATILLLTSVSTRAQEQSPDRISGTRAFVEGLSAFEQNEYNKSVELLLQAKSKLGNNSGVNYALADTYYAMEDLPNAALYGKQAVRLDPKNKWYRFKLANIYRSAGENKATLNELNEILRLYPNDYDALFMLADTHRDYGEFVKSNQVLDKALKLTGPSIPIFLLKFRNYEAMGIPDSAISQLQQMRKVDPDNLTTLNLLSDYYASSGNEENAKKVLTEALERNSRDPKSLISLAGIYIEEQKWDSAGTLIRTFLSDKIILPEQKLSVAQFLYNKQQDYPRNQELKKQTSLALQAYTESSDEYGPAFTLSGQYFAQIGDIETALKMLEQGNNLLPEDDIAWRLRLQLLLSENRLLETIEVGNKANQFVPEDAFIQFFVGSAYLLNDESEQAIPWLKQASRAPARKPFKSVVYATLGDAYSDENNADEADRAYELSLRFDPENHNAMNNYAYNLAVRAQKLDRAKELALKAMELEPENVAYLDTIGWVYFKLGEYEKARKFIKASIDLDENLAGAEVMEHLGDVYDKLNQPDEANKWWKRALELDKSRVHLKKKIQ